MRPTIVIIGAGPRIGMATARRFGAEGFRAALVARDAGRLDRHVRELGAEGIEARAFPADAADPAALEEALAEIQREAGPAQVLLHNAAGAPEGLAPVLDVTVDGARDAFGVTVLAAVTAVRAVLPAMVERGSGTLLFTSGVSAIHPIPYLGNVGIAVAGLRNYALALAEALDGTGVRVGHLPIAAVVAPGSPASPETVAETHWSMHAGTQGTEVVLGDVALVRAAVARLA
ncbi:SDR family NAD(P)-dependent oxidoreductase [Microbispora sp. ATCC PTA-5024]|uniref:SDR family NAD(P)-dependent oxidoreductase n=1 Tax=Microbispora sp. ATCC PTA-5024 TaxID=316330 RepID=UPI0003FDBB52|nr:SDR family oxidoreductase [Microbispora sp. ATCC PTA-5024]